MSFQILCATMFQKDFSKLEKMNIHSDIVFANQDTENSVEEIKYDGQHTARMVTTDTRGVGINRNIALLNATADICLLADDDVTYFDNMEELVVNEFSKFPSADIIIFYLEADNKERALEKYEKTTVYRKYMRKPWGAVRVAFRLNSIKKANIWFSTLFGGGSIYASGEDSLWINDAVKKGLKIIISDKCIGNIYTGKSSWYSGKNEFYYYGKGAYYRACYSKTYSLWMLYFALRTQGMTDLSFSERLKWMKNGVDGYKDLLSYEDFTRRFSI